ncbi:hypothetical protein C8R43DRAFT_1104906 [Mycena crocata]|nr:hypothetical protein C8R43DRAFT_1104906 [Mycena crocata]
MFEFLVGEGEGVDIAGDNGQGDKDLRRQEMCGCDVHEEIRIGDLKTVDSDRSPVYHIFSFLTLTIPGKTQQAIMAELRRERKRFMSYPACGYHRSGAKCLRYAPLNSFYCPKQKPRKIAAVDENKMPKKDVWSVLGLVLAQFWVNQK